jgi:hypothetical protein
VLFCTHVVFPRWRTVSKNSSVRPIAWAALRSETRSRL